MDVEEIKKNNDCNLKKNNDCNLKKKMIVN